MGQTLVWGVVLAALYGLLLWRALGLGIQDRIPWYVTEAIPPALSVLHFNHPANFTGLTVVRDRIPIADRTIRSDGLNAAIDDVLRMDPATTSRDTYFLGLDDKGIVDYVLLSFVLFGARTESLLYAYFLIIAVASVAFFWSHHRRPMASFALATYFLALSAFLAFVPLYPQLISPVGMRSIVILALIPTLHLILAAVLPCRHRPVDIFLLAVQAVLIAFVIHIRSSGWWTLAVVAAVGLMGAVAAFARARSDRTATTPQLGDPLWRQAGRSLVPATLALGIFVGFNTLTALRFADEYRNGSERAGHVVWHSLYSGFAFHPEAHAEEGIKIDDESVMLATGEFLKRHGRDDEWVRLGGTNPRFSGFDWVAYDQIVKELYLDTLRRRPDWLLTSIAVYRPLAWIDTMRWMMRFDLELSYLALVHPGLAEQLRGVSLEMDTRRQYLNWGAPVSIAAALVLGWIARRTSAPPDRRVWVAILALVAGAFISPLAVYPTPHTIAESAVATGILFYLVLGVVGAWGVDWLVARLRAR